MKSLDRDSLQNNPYEGISDEELVRRYHEGERDIMEYLLRKYSPLTLKLSNAYFIMGYETEDIIQEAMIGLIHAIQDYDASKGASFFTFAELCIERKLNTEVKRSQNFKNMSLNTSVSFQTEESEDGLSLEEVIGSGFDESPEQQFINEETRKLFFQKLRDRLSEKEQKILDLFLEGKKYTVIAKELGLEAKSVDNAIQRIRKKTFEVSKSMKKI